MTSDPSGRILSVSQSEDWHKKEKIFFLFPKDFRTEESSKALFYLRGHTLITLAHLTIFDQPSNFVSMFTN